MEKLVLEKDEEAIYRLEVNDEGEYIEFDLADLTLPQRIMEASDRLSKIDGEFQQKAIEAEKIKDNVEKVRKQLELDKEYAKEMRNIFDSFLGEGACQKIFGDKERYGQYQRLMDALTPHFDKMKIDIDKAKKRIIERIKDIQEKDVM